MAAVTGIGCVCAVGGSLESILDNLESAPPLPTLPGWTTEPESTHPVFAVGLGHASDAGVDLSADHGLDMLLECARQALDAAGLPPGALAGKRVGVCIGSADAYSINQLSMHHALRQGSRDLPVLLSSFRHANYALALKTRLGLSGPCQLTATACASGTDAIGVGAAWIASGACDMVLAGGVDRLSISVYRGFIQLSLADIAPCRPFDRTRNGLNLGEGAAVLLLEPARASGKAVDHVLGYGTANDAHHPTAPHPKGRGLRRAFQVAMRRAGVNASDIAFVSAHGTATRENDKVESLVLRDVFPDVPVLATKGATGHTLGAAGAIEAAITLGCLARGVIPASPGFREPDSELGLCPTRSSTRLDRQVAVSDSLGFGGGNAALVLGGEAR